MAAPELRGKRALVTGASQGIGAEIARSLVSCGVEVVLAGRDRPSSSLVQVAEELREKGGSVSWLHADLQEPEQVLGLAQEALAIHPVIDILVNNAGIVHALPALEETPETWQQTLAVNLVAPFLLAQQLAPAMMRQGEGRIVMIGSAAGLVGFPNRASYAASKGGLAMLTRQLAVEWGPAGITVNCVAPTVTLTPMAQKAWADPQKRQAMENSIPVRRLATPSDVAAAVLSFLQPSAGMMNGVVLPVDGGYTIR